MESKFSPSNSNENCDQPSSVLVSIVVKTLVTAVIGGLAIYFGLV